MGQGERLCSAAGLAALYGNVLQLSGATEDPRDGEGVNGRRGPMSGKLPGGDQDTLNLPLPM